ncbi:uncharacterized protein LOC101852479 [Aplysia californica]|uniref:Uncharacterized protein LOC101852479 n=1 Tax=Aplysia californica TaxID=6500 RepID=A0ABM0JRC8_APLCA|nr:uncharacterized protein LOC101852479 [Aplysia californica]
MSAIMDIKCAKDNDKRERRKRQKSFTEALKEKYCMDNDEHSSGNGYIIISPKRKNSPAELAHLKTVVLNEMSLAKAGIPQQGLTSLCPNVVDLDLASNMFEHWSELLTILSHLPRVKYVNVSRNSLRLKSTDELPSTHLSVENLALNDTGVSIEEVVRLSQIMPALKELHLCGNSYESLANIEDGIRDGHLSSVECLRLNNNAIKSWSEVWKLRHMQQLKDLILSGNPLDKIFYDLDDQVCCDDQEVASKPGVSCDGDSTVCEEEIFLQMSTDCGDCGMSDDDNNSGDGEFEFRNLSGAGDEDDDHDFGERPVSRFDRHEESDVSDDAETTSTSAVSSVDMEMCCGGGGPSNANYNNSHSTPPHKSLYGAEMAEESGAWFGVFPSDELLDGDATESFFEGEPATHVEGEGGEDWHKTVAEAFLQEIINNLDFQDSVGDSAGGSGQCRTSADKQQPAQMVVSSASSATEAMSDSSHSEGSATMAPSPSHSHLLGATDRPAGGNCGEGSDRQQYLPEANTNQNAFSDAVLKTESQGGLDIVQNNRSCRNLITTASSMAVSDPTWEMNSSSSIKSRSADMNRCNVKRNIFAGPACGNIALCTAGGVDVDTPVRGLTASSESCGVSKQQRSCDQCEQQQQLPAEKCSVDQSSLISNVQAGLSACESRNRESCQSSDVGRDSCRCDGPTETSSHSKQKAGWVRESMFFSNEPRLRIINSNKTSRRDPLDLSPTESMTTPPPSLSATNVNHPPPLLPECGSSPDFVKCQSENGADSPGGASSSPRSDTSDRRLPFQNLETLCLSNAGVSHWRHLHALGLFPKLTNVRMLENPLYSSVHPEDRRKLYISSLPNVKVLNGSEVTHMEREKAESHYLRYFMDADDKPEFYHTLVQKHGPPVKLVDIDLGAGYQEWASLTFVHNGVAKFTKKLHLTEPVVKLRTLISKQLGLPKRSFMMYHNPCGPSHPEYERELTELRCESLPMSRFDFAEGDEIHVDA